jgi:hypothetical protein
VRSLYLASSRLLFLLHFCLLKLLHPLTCMFPFIVSVYNIWLVIGFSSFSLHLLIPQYSHFASLICYY